MNTNLKKLLAVIGLFLIIFGVYKLNKSETVQYDSSVVLEKNSNNVYLQDTTDRHLDTLIRLGLQELKIDNVQVIVKPLLDGDGIMKNTTLDAYLVSYAHGTYFLYVKDFSKKGVIVPIAHELIHLKQYHDKRLIISGQTLYWDGQVELLEQAMAVSYKSRAWEREAFEKQTALADTLRKKLIKTNK